MKKEDLIYLVILIIFIAIICSTIAVPAFGAERDYIYPDDCYQMCEEIAGDRISPEFLQSVIEHESNYNALAVNGTCTGLMQINPKWHQNRMNRLGVTDLYDPYQNIMVGADYLCELFDKNDDAYWVLMMYNMSSDKANELSDRMEYTDYAVGICERAEELEEEHGKTQY